MHDISVIQGKTDLHVLVDPTAKLDVLPGVPTYALVKLKGRSPPLFVTFYYENRGDLTVFVST